MGAWETVPADDPLIRDRGHRHTGNAPVAALSPLLVPAGAGGGTLRLMQPVVMLPSDANAAAGGGADASSVPYCCAQATPGLPGELEPKWASGAEL